MNAKIMTVTNAKATGLNNRRPAIKFRGLWLNEIGFEKDNLVELQKEAGSLLFKVHSKGIETYGRLVKSLLKSKSDLIQIQQSRANQKDVPAFDVKGKWLENLGFKIGSVILVQYGTGIIKVRLIDLEKLE